MYPNFKEDLMDEHDNFLLKNMLLQNKREHINFLSDKLLNSANKLLKELYGLGLWNSLFICNVVKDGIEIVAFDSTVYSKESINFFLNNIENIKEFIIYFRRNLNMYDTIPLVTTPYNLQHLVNNKHLLLSDIEKDIFFFLSKGLNTRQIAERLFRLHRTVENIIYNLKEKFQKTKGELIYLYNQQFL
jgi:hypothetical protein